MRVATARASGLPGTENWPKKHSLIKKSKSEREQYAN